MWSHAIDEPGIPADRRLFVRAYAIDVPDGLAWLRLCSRFEDTALVNLFLVDPDGATRVQHWGLRSGEELVLRHSAEPGDDGLWPGAVPGPLPPGTWRLLVAAMVRPGSEPRYRIELDGDAGAAPARAAVETRRVPWIGRPAAPGQDAYDRYDFHRTAGRGARWYRGDFHLHTLLSDSKLSAEQLSALAQARGLEFAVITEHNTLTTAWCDTPLLVIPGDEFTSTRGHWNSLGTRTFPPLWHGTAPVLESGDGMEAVLRQQARAGALCSLNHPLLPPWAWQWPDVPMDLFHTLEVQNDPTYPDNDEATERALVLWDRLWALGHRIAGVGGSDVHLLPGESHVPGGPPQEVGDPATCVWAEELSPAAILAAVRRGRIYVTRGPALDPRAECGGQRYLPGDHLPDDGRPVRLRVALDGEPAGGRLRWLENGREVATQPLAGGRAYEWTTAAAPGVYRWLRLEVRDVDERLVAFTGPVSVGPRPEPPATRWRDVAPASGH